MRKGFFILCGPPGAGKSTAAAATFPESLYIQSSPNLLSFYENEFVRHGKGAMPKRVLTIDQYSVDGQVQVTKEGEPIPVGQKAALEHYVLGAWKQAMQAKAAGKPPPWKNLVIDEVGTFWSRIFEEIKPTVLTRSGAIDTRGAYGVLGSWSLWMVNQLRQLLVAGVNVVFISHVQEPDPTQEKKGGPKMPTQGIMHQLCADSDGTLLLTYEDIEIGKTARVWIVHGKQNWITKLRGLPDSAYTEVKTWPLEKIIRAAGYEP